ncbi:glycoside hydrolase family 15 protein [Aquihabitans sp. McL0605]|uniref:glycoside hydrolase family 15 protein n=1 Tax=Aquihabitans sp. McL0605 TaxID=3415671 RepID=UPI003CF67781
MADTGFEPISSYAFLADGRSTVLVSRDASIDWACLDRFDAASTFGRLLDADRGGSFQIRPTSPILERSRRYLPGTMVLSTVLTTADGTLCCTDALARTDTSGGANGDSRIVRSIEVTAGEVEVELLIEPRFDYGATTPWVRDHGGCRYSAVGGDQAVVVGSSQELDLDRDGGRLTGRLALRPDGGSWDLVLVAQQPHRLVPDAAVASSVADLLDQTKAWWRGWSARTQVVGRDADTIRRSAMVLKGLSCERTGGIVAAATTSLPEVVGGPANWDYRYCWVRDAALTVDALDQLGHHGSAQAFRDFVLRSSAGQGDEVQVLYGTYGQRSLPEREVDHLSGWRGSGPVRVGNAAAGQRQLDCYGHVLDVAHLWHDRHGVLDADEWRFLASVVDAATRYADDEDAGIWETRGPLQHFVHSKVMAWVAADRGIRLAEEQGLPAPRLEAWKATRRDLRQAVDRRGVDPDRGNFVSHFGTRAVDASLLRLPLVGFVAADDDRMRTTTDVIIDELADTSGLLRRNRHDVGSTDEGLFLLCTCWLIEVLVLQGRRSLASELYDAVLAAGNDLGLFSEEVDPSTGEMLGNFPQAFTHLGLIKAGLRLRRGVDT